MEDKSIAFELIREQAKTSKSLTIVICVLVFCLAFSNMAWLYVWNQYDYEVYETDIELTAGENGGSAVYLSEEGEGSIIHHGEGTSKKEKEIMDKEGFKRQEDQ